MADFTRGLVSTLPSHNGDGYSWGGDIILSFGEWAVNFGTSQNYSERQRLLVLARLLAAAPTMLEALRDLLFAVGGGSKEEWPEFIAARAAIAAATGDAK